MIHVFTLFSMRTFDIKLPYPSNFQF